MGFRHFLVIILVQFLPELLISQVTFPNNLSTFNKSRVSSTNLKFENTYEKSDFVLKSDYPLSYNNSISLGLKSFQLNDNRDQITYSKWIRGSIVPVSLIVAGVITKLAPIHSFLNEYSIRNKVQTMFPGAQSPIDNYLQFAPLVTIFGMKASGVTSRSDLVNLCMITAKAELLMCAIVGGMKLGIRSDRESNGLNAMPSGHTAQAFLSATILDMEYRDVSPWTCVAGYTIAATTGMYRLINDTHLISEVLVGAGIGIFSTKAVYFTHRYRWGKKNHAVIFPVIYKNGGGISYSIML